MLIGSTHEEFNMKIYLYYKAVFFDIFSFRHLRGLDKKCNVSVTE